MNPEELFNPSLPPHCFPTSSFLLRVSEYFGTCVPTPLAFVSTSLGALSILSWLFAQMPQIYKNYQIQSTAGLSIFFLAEWLLGDLTNLLGALFTHQAGWQVVVASYYTFVDICLVVQYFWYSHLKPKLVGGSLHSDDSSYNRDDDSEFFSALSPINTNFVEDLDQTPKVNANDSRKSSRAEPVNVPSFTQVNYEKKQSDAQTFSSTYKLGESWKAMPSPKTVVRIAVLGSLAAQTVAAPTTGDFHIRATVVYTPLKLAGTILSWSSTLLYLGSRLPQLYKNWKRKSTAGLSPLLFIAAFCGNLFYSSSLLTNPNAWHNFGSHGGRGWVDKDGSSRADWIARATPFFLGAAGVLLMDAMMGVQFLLYSEREAEVVRVRDSHGFSRWEKVNGWMRGWIPEMKKARVVDLAESQRLISESREIDRLSRSYGGV